MSEQVKLDLWLPGENNPSQESNLKKAEISQTLSSKDMFLRSLDDAVKCNWTIDLDGFRQTIWVCSDVLKTMFSEIKENYWEINFSLSINFLGRNVKLEFSNGQLVSIQDPYVVYKNNWKKFICVIEKWKDKEYHNAAKRIIKIYNQSIK